MEIFQSTHHSKSTRDLYFLPLVKSTPKLKHRLRPVNAESAPACHTDTIESIMARKQTSSGIDCTSPEAQSIQCLTFDSMKVGDLYNKYDNLPAVVENIDRRHRK